ncbi:MAG: beta-ketoacyl-ACP synthase II [Rickettsiales bacterium]|jgi:3-oxoacyl-[acyl-carrier-protein] synthase II|nr:beta-ketoacyl-ACP synthase II [Rickettsiales bacterium]
MERRVVVTGVGALTPVGLNCSETWDSIVNSRSGIRRISKIENIGEQPDSVSKVAGEIVVDENRPGAFNPDYLFSDKKDVNKTDEFIWYGLAAAREAIVDAGLESERADDELGRIGVIMGSGVGGLKRIQNIGIDSHRRGIKKISPFYVPQILINMTAGHISIMYGFRGPSLALSTACSTGTHAIGEAMLMIKRGDADVMIAGSSEAPICALGVGGFSSMHALSTKFNDEPEKASRPWDRDRDGFVMAEGAAVVVLEEYGHAKKRNARIYCEAVGYGASSDAYHITSPDPKGRGAKKAMEIALEKAGLNPEDIDYINAHGTSTVIGDSIEFAAVRDVFYSSSDRVLMSSTKSSIGHMLGAAGSVEAVFLVKAIESGIAPPTLNLDNLDENCHGIDLVPKVAREKKIICALSNSFGFGGTNATIIMKKI